MTYTSFRPRVANHAAVEGYSVDTYVALAPNDDIIVDEILTVATGGALKGATTVTITTGLTNKMYKGQALTFYNPTTKVETLVELNADAAPGATSLTVRALAKALTAGDKAEFPVNVWDRSSNDLDESSNFSGVSGNNDDRGGQNGTITGGDFSYSINGRFHYENAGAATMRYARPNGLKCWFKRQLPNTNSNFYTTGPAEQFYGFVTQRATPAATDGNVEENFSIQGIGTITRILPTPVA